MLLKLSVAYSTSCVPVSTRTFSDMKSWSSSSKIDHATMFAMLLTYPKVRASLAGDLKKPLRPDLEKRWSGIWTTKIGGKQCLMVIIKVNV